MTAIPPEAVAAVVVGAATALTFVVTVLGSPAEAKKKSDVYERIKAKDQQERRDRHARGEFSDEEEDVPAAAMPIKQADTKTARNRKGKKKPSTAPEADFAAPAVADASEPGADGAVGGAAVAAAAPTPQPKSEMQKKAEKFRAGLPQEQEQAVRQFLDIMENGSAMDRVAIQCVFILFMLGCVTMLCIIIVVAFKVDVIAAIGVLFKKVKEVQASLEQNVAHA
eukprot:CAMPEP_0204363552 /NCGR_PEP_ID=MMETSP0469-20131031/40461_1 /ASSEMBLY_ACC=CAM_ASM_000384 /TAXON_ID=2969 /ORGANISM="Oxyrrhis marina" /LENGTH=223 /DNA_ID=CAMNT_0051352321 /DNA_START=13 /DNA_END=684 /DNA_ORIENTATION=-